jgi:ABC-type phosphate/phosphonate transport system substrate-binding protein
MKKVVTLAIAALMTIGTAYADSPSTISEFRIGILGGENAQDRLNSNECLRTKTEELLGVETKLFAPGKASHRPGDATSTGSFCLSRARSQFPDPGR